MGYAELPPLEMISVIEGFEARQLDDSRVRITMIGVVKGRKVTVMLSSIMTIRL